MKDLVGKNAIVTGASKGIGRHVAIALARRGVRVATAPATDSAASRAVGASTTPRR